MRSLILFAALLGSLLSGCETNLIDNPSFDRWCGEDLCDWTTEAGKIERVGSWHEKDYAVSFVDKGTRISQLSTSSLPSGCIRFEMIADVDPLAQLTMQIDFQDDGSIDKTQLLTGNWETTPIVVQTPRSYSKVRYTFVKLGSGHAVLAQLWAEDEFGCTSDGGS